MSMTIGMMNNHINIYKITTIKDEYGDTTTTKTLFHSCWCYVRNQTMKDIQASIGTLLENTISLVIRHTNKQITNEMTIELNGISYKIISIENDIQRKQFDTIIVKRVG
ncbi:phage head closure protein [Rummeliibacillus pycnus]|uniref:phage head closure protein n=1 Tax=Rummeliibacillus pycnus TaxID=101070 RepID=UPI000C9B8862|nr:phage head closure protein [Rummeliibacillus pycnus]